MSLAHDLLLGARMAAPIIGAAILVALATRRADAAADSHDVSDYHAPADPAPPIIWHDPAAEAAYLRRRRPRPVIELEPEPEPEPEPDRAAVVAAVVAAQPFDPATVPWRPPYAELVIAQVLRRYGDSPADIAGRWLRDIADVERQAVAA